MTDIAMTEAAGERHYDVVIVGGGPAGLSAGVYAARAGLSAVVLEQSTPGGQIAITDEVDNYPGLPGLSGAELGMKLSEHAEQAGATLEYDVVSSIARSDDGSFVITAGGSSYRAGSVIYAAGATPRLAGFEGEEKFRGRGVSYCATCDGMFYRGKDVYVVGGGTAACEEALFLARIARSVTMLVRKDVLRTTPALTRRILAADSGVTVRFTTRVAEVSGEQMLGSITLEDTRSGEREVISHDEPFGVFVFVGHDPATALVDGLVETNANGIVTDARMSTRTPGLFAAGDVRDTVLRQAVTAAADGAVAATSALTYLQAREA